MGFCSIFMCNGREQYREKVVKAHISTLTNLYSQECMGMCEIDFSYIMIKGIIVPSSLKKRHSIGSIYNFDVVLNDQTVYYQRFDLVLS